MIGNKKMIRAFLTLLLLQQCTIMMSSTNEINLPVQENINSLVEVSDLPSIDVDIDELSFCDQSFYNEYDTHIIEYLEQKKISYFQQKLRELGIIVLLKYIETKEFMGRTYVQIKRVMQHMLFRM